MTDKRTLKLTIDREYFDNIATGQKTEEYRERKAYWATRLEGRDFDKIRFCNGYGPDVPVLEAEYKGFRKTTRKGKPVYAIKIGKILSKKNWPGPADDISGT